MRRSGQSSANTGASREHEGTPRAYSLISLSPFAVVVLLLRCSAETLAFGPSIQSSSLPYNHPYLTASPPRGSYTSTSRITWLFSEAPAQSEPLMDSPNEVTINVTVQSPDTITNGIPVSNGIKDSGLGVHAERNGASPVELTENGYATDDGGKNRRSWRRRHARSIEEGIRRETSTQLSSLFNAERLAPNPKKYFARVIAGLIHALADEVIGLEVDVDARRDTPLWNKHINAIQINFSRLGFQPLRMGGLHDAIQSFEDAIPVSEKDRMAEDLELSAVSTMDEAFERMDADNSGTLDQEEIAHALNMAASSQSDQQLLVRLASQLVSLYDVNGDGVVDREEYQFMVEDMAALREVQKEKQQKRDGVKKESSGGMFKSIKGLYQSVVGKDDNVTEIETPEAPKSLADAAKELGKDPALNVPGSGTIVFSDMKVDLRRLPFGAIPVVKSITPGGPLFLEPFTATMIGSFNKDDVMGSALLDAGFRRLVARALRRRVRSFRDIVDGALFVGRSWNMASKQAPVVEVPQLTSVEFDSRNRMVITGRARIQTSPDVPVIENAFKVRTKLGTRKNGRVIRLEQPELALVVECPKAWERNIVSACKRLGLPVPERPDPIYSFFPIYSPFKVEDNDGFDLGPDNQIKSIYIKQGALRFELSAVLRPGRFLGSHYLAFSVPKRTFIITMDRVRAALKSARKHKREMARLKKEAVKMSRIMVKDAGKTVTVELPKNFKHEDLSFADPTQQQQQPNNNINNGSSNKKTTTKPKAKSFFSRFVEGYTGVSAQDDAMNERLTIAISDWFGRQSENNDGTDDD